MSQSTGIETNGVEQIPDDQRHAAPLDLFRLIFGGANTFATAVLGSFPVLFGLSFQAGVWAILLGVGIGAIILAPMGLFGALNGTNNAVSSGAHFGVHGRIVGSFLSLLTAVAFFSLSVWSSGDALVGGAKRLAGLPETDLTLGLAYFGNLRTVPGSGSVLEGAAVTAPAPVNTSPAAQIPGNAPAAQTGGTHQHLGLALHHCQQHPTRKTHRVEIYARLFGNRRRPHRQSDGALALATGNLFRQQMMQRLTAQRRRQAPAQQCQNALGRAAALAA